MSRYSVDVDCSGSATVADTQLLLQMAVFGAPPAAVDGDSNGCVAACDGCATTGGSCLIGGKCMAEGDMSAPRTQSLYWVATS